MQHEQRWQWWWMYLSHNPAAENRAGAKGVSGVGQLQHNNNNNSLHTIEAMDWARRFTIYAACFSSTENDEKASMGVPGDIHSMLIVGIYIFILRLRANERG